MPTYFIIRLYIKAQQWWTPFLPLHFKVKCVILLCSHEGTVVLIIDVLLIM